MNRIPILCVDDEPHIVRGLRLNLRRHFDVWTATSGAEALELLAERGAPHIVVSDMRMPGMDGAELLAAVRSGWPSAIRVLLTGHAGLSAAIKAVNQGGIFRFLVKPCPPPQLIAALQLAERQHQLERAEHELLEQTLGGVIAMLTQLMALAAPEALGHAQRVRALAAATARELRLEDAWQVELAALLADVGSLVDPPGDDDGAATTAELLRTIPRLDRCSAMIARRAEAPEPAACEAAWAARDPIALGAMILRLAHTVDAGIQSGEPAGRVLRHLDASGGPFARAVLGAMDTAVRNLGGSIESLPVKALRPGLVLDENLVARNGTLIVPAGEPLSPVIIRRVQIFAARTGVKEPVRVRVPSRSDTADEQTRPHEYGERLARIA